LHGSDQKKIASAGVKIVSIFRAKAIMNNFQHSTANRFARRSSPANNNKKKKG
jgi:hypothetical protein